MVFLRFLHIFALEASSTIITLLSYSPSPSWAHLGTILCCLGPILGHLGPILEPSWGHLSSSSSYHTHLRHLGAILGRLGAILGHLGPSWGHPGAILGHLGAILGPQVEPQIVKNLWFSLSFCTFSLLKAHPS